MSTFRVRPVAAVVVLALAAGAWAGTARLVWVELDYRPRATLPGSELEDRDSANPRGPALRLTPGLSPDGQSFALLYYPDGADINNRHRKSELRVYDIATAAERFRLPADIDLEGAAFSPDGKWLLGTEHVWNAETGEVWVKHRAVMHPQYCRISPDSRTLAVLESPHQMGGEYSAVFADLTTKREVLRIEHVELDSINHMSFSRDGTRAAVPLGWAVAVADLSSGRVRTIKSEANVVAISPDGSTLATCSGGVFGPDRGPGPETVRLWDVETSAGKDGPRHLATVVGLAFARGGKFLVSWTRERTELAGNPRDVKVWNVSDSKDVLHFEAAGFPPQLLCDRAVLAHARQDSSSDGLWLLSGPPRQLTGRLLRVQRGPHSYTYISDSDGRFLVTLDTSSPKRPDPGSTIRVLDTNAEASEKVFPDVGFHVEAAQVTPDGKHLLATGWGGRVVYETDGGKSRDRLPVTFGSFFEFTPDGRAVVSWDRDGPVRVWDFPFRKPTGPWAWPASVAAGLILFVGGFFVLRRRNPGA